MVEVFKTNVCDWMQADMLLSHIHNTFMDYRANFDLDDCDKILRVECATGNIKTTLLVNLLKKFGYSAEVLPDEYKPAVQLLFTVRE